MPENADLNDDSRDLISSVIETSVGSSENR